MTHSTARPLGRISKLLFFVVWERANAKRGVYMKYFQGHLSCCACPSCCPEIWLRNASQGEGGILRAIYVYGSSSAYASPSSPGLRTENRKPFFSVGFRKPKPSALGVAFFSVNTKRKNRTQKTESFFFPVPYINIAYMYVLKPHYVWTALGSTQHAATEQSITATIYNALYTYRK